VCDSYESNGIEEYCSLVAGDQVDDDPECVCGVKCGLVSEFKGGVTLGDN
jgi:hypothetical protein